MAGRIIRAGERVDIEKVGSDLKISGPYEQRKSE